MTKTTHVFSGVALMALVALSPLASGTAHTQASRPTFDVASVKTNKTGDLAQRIQPSPGRFTATNVSLRGLVRFAFELQDFQLDGGPSWLASDRFDIAATLEDDAPLARVRLMLRVLVEDRFKLKTHLESRDQPIYALVIARSDGRLGSQLRKSEADCSRAGAPAPSGAAGGFPCGSFGPAPGVPITAARLAFRGMPMETFARSLAPIVRRVVVDRTGLAGNYDAEFDASAELPPPPPPPGSGIPNPFDPQNMASIFTVLQEQLGLKLESTRAPVSILVIDGAEKPMEN